MDASKVIAEIDELLSRAHLSPGDRLSIGGSGNVPGFSDGEVTGLVTSMLAAIDRLTPTNSLYRQVANSDVERRSVNSAFALETVIGVLNALRAHYERGYVSSIAELIHADVFADFLEMAIELLDKGYKDPAAVIAGSVLEEHLRKLADKSGVPTADANGKSRKADTINADLVKTNVYGKLEQKQVTAWQDLRNNAAHGKYTEYEVSQVRLMLDGVRDFLVRHPA